MPDTQKGDNAQGTKRKARAMAASDSDDDTIIPLMKRRNTKATPAAQAAPSSTGQGSKPPSRAASEKPRSTRATSQKPSLARRGKQQQPLFEASDEDETPAPSQPATAPDEDSEEEVRPTRRATQRRKPVVAEDDSDDDGLKFKGFGARRRR